MDASSRDAMVFAVFGRDAVVTSLQTMAVSYEFGRGTLIKLAQLQATQVDDWHDAQQNFARTAAWQLAQHMKFPHLTGTVDATILWLLPSRDLSLEC